MIKPKKRWRKIRSKFYEKWIPFHQKILNPEEKREKTERIKANNQEELIFDQEKDAGIIPTILILLINLHGGSRFVFQELFLLSHL